MNPTPTTESTTPQSPDGGPQAPFLLGEWTVFPAELCLRQNDRTLRLQQKEMALLLALVERGTDRPLRSDDLRRAVWGGQAIADGAVKNLVWQLRTTLGESADRPVLIHTVPGAGYRLGAQPSPLPVDDAPTDAEPSQVASSEPSNPVVVEPSPESRASAERKLPQRTFLVVIGIAAAFAAGVGLLRLEGPDHPSGSVSEPTYGAPQPITGLAGREWSLNLDPSGRYLLFAGEDQPGGPSKLYRLDLDAELPTPVRLTSDERAEESDGRWSPEGRRIAFVRRETAPDGPSQGFEIHVMASTGGPSKLLMSPPGAGRPSIAWHPDGESLFVNIDSEEELSNRLHRLRLSDGRLEPIGPEQPQGCCVVSHPAVSPDGRRLGFMRWSSPHSVAIGVLRLSDGTERIVADDLPFLNSLDWQADGKSLLFTGRIDGASAIWQVQVDGDGAPKRFPPTDGMMDVGEVTVAPSGRIVYEQSVFDVDILQFNGLDGLGLDGEGFGSNALSPPKRIHPSDRAEMSYTPSPDGRRAVFLSDRSGKLELWLAEEGQAERPLAVPGIAINSRPRWSPDGSQLALSLRVDDQSDIALLRPADGHLRWLTRTPDREMVPSWRPDGLAVRYARPLESQEDWALWEQDLWREGQARPLVEPGQVAQVSVDGRLIYSYAGGGLLRRLGDGSPELLSVDVGPREWSNWHVVEKGIYSLRVGEKAVRFYDFETRSTTDVVELPYPATRGGLTVSADGHSLFVSVVIRDTSGLRILPIASEGP